MSAETNYKLAADTLVLVEGDMIESDKASQYHASGI